MKRLLMFAVAAIAGLAVTTADCPNAEAQSYRNGFQFGTGVNQSFRGNNAHRNRYGGGFFGGGGFGVGTIGILDRIEEPPYFARFPPVYYSGIVRRPYGISPYAAPPGIAPVELTVPVAVEPLTVKNPYVSPTNVATPTQPSHSILESGQESGPDLVPADDGNKTT